MDNSDLIAEICKHFNCDISVAMIIFERAKQHEELDELFEELNK